jgi:CBS domain-containing protein
LFTVQVHVIASSTVKVRRAAMNAREVMTSPVISATAGTSVRDVAQLLLENHISAVPVLDSDRAVIGMVSEAAASLHLGTAFPQA